MLVTVEHEDASEVWIRVLSDAPPANWEAVGAVAPVSVREKLTHCFSKPFNWHPGQPSDFLDPGELPDHDYEFEDFFYFKKAAGG